MPVQQQQATMCFSFLTRGGSNWDDLKSNSRDSSFMRATELIYSADDDVPLLIRQLKTIQL